MANAFSIISGHGTLTPQRLLLNLRRLLLLSNWQMQHLVRKWIMLVLANFDCQILTVKPPSWPSWQGFANGQQHQ